MTANESALFPYVLRKFPAATHVQMLTPNGLDSICLVHFVKGFDVAYLFNFLGYAGEIWEVLGIDPTTHTHNQTVTLFHETPFNPSRLSPNRAGC